MSNENEVMEVSALLDEQHKKDESAQGKNTENNGENKTEVKKNYTRKK